MSEPNILPKETPLVLSVSADQKGKAVAITIEPDRITVHLSTKMESALRKRCSSHWNFERFAFDEVEKQLFPHPQMRLLTKAGRARLDKWAPLKMKTIRVIEVQDLGADVQVTELPNGDLEVRVSPSMHAELKEMAKERGLRGSAEVVKALFLAGIADLKAKHKKA